MVKPDNSMLEMSIHNFLVDYDPSFQGLIETLDEARISHYSSGCGPKSITFDIFPASGQVEEMLRMLSLNRKFKKTGSGLKDVSVKGGPNPANDFLLYLRRWSGFAEQVMKREGDSSRGVAAARAKLIMDDLGARLGAKQGSRTPTEFATLMEAIGLALSNLNTTEHEFHKVKSRQASEHNYRKALALAQANKSSTTSQAA